MKDNSVVLISMGGFLAITIKDALKERNVEVIDVKPSVEELEEHRYDADVFLVLLGKFPPGMPSVFELLKEICWNKKDLFVLGEAQEIKSLEEYIPAALIAKTFERPFSAADVASTVCNWYDMKDVSADLPEILVIDDDPVFLWTIRGYLSDAYDVKVANSALDGIRYLSSNKPDLILLDYEMPVTNGDTVAQMLSNSEETKDIPVMFLTGKDDKETVMKVLTLKPEGYLLKSLEGRQIHAAIDQFFARDFIGKL